MSIDEAKALASLYEALDCLESATSHHAKFMSIRSYARCLRALSAVRDVVRLLVFDK